MTLLARSHDVPSGADAGARSSRSRALVSGLSSSAPELVASLYFSVKKLEGFSFQGTHLDRSRGLCHPCGRSSDLAPVSRHAQPPRGPLGSCSRAEQAPPRDLAGTSPRHLHKFCWRMGAHEEKTLCHLFHSRTTARFYCLQF